MGGFRRGVQAGEAVERQRPGADRQQGPRRRRDADEPVCGGRGFPERNETDQDVDQTQGGSKRDPRNGSPYGSSYDPRHDSGCCGSDGIYIQAAGQESKSEQGARSDADSTQYGASNTNAPVRIDSKGGGGDVTQTNASLAAAISANGNKTDQDVDQTQPGGLIAEPKRDLRGAVTRTRCTSRLWGSRPRTISGPTPRRTRSR